MSVTIEQCDSLLPQTQCRECGYNGCRPYAQALVSGVEININRCRPGGQDVIDALAALFVKPSVAPEQDPLVCTAIVQVETCIGCTLCIQACPVDAILGAAKMQHQIIEEACTGCSLCLPVCPTACIVLKERVLPLPSPQDNRQRIAQRQATLEKEQLQRMTQHRSSVARLNDPQAMLALCRTKEKKS